jgi:hypothetical protein
MFLNTIKSLILKNKVSKLLSNSHVNQVEVIQSVGVVLDGTLGLDVENLVNDLIEHGIEENAIKVLIFKDKLNKNEVFKFDFFSYKDFSWSGEIENPNAQLFLNTNFDLLINYHNFEKTPLVYISYLSNAYLKVGFVTQDKRANQLMVNTSPSNYQLFIDELFKYLKILKKI